MEKKLNNCPAPNENDGPKTIEEVRAAIYTAIYTAMASFTENNPGKILKVSASTQYEAGGTNSTIDQKPMVLGFNVFIEEEDLK